MRNNQSDKTDKTRNRNRCAGYQRGSKKGGLFCLFQIDPELRCRLLAQADKVKILRLEEQKKATRKHSQRDDSEKNRRR